MFNNLPASYQEALKPYQLILDYKPTQEGWAVPESYRVEPFTPGGKPLPPPARNWAPRFVYHTPEFVHRDPEAMRRFFATFTKPTHWWQSNQGENSVSYPDTLWGSRKRRITGSKRKAKQLPDSRHRIDHNSSYKPFNLALQRIPFTQICWGLLGTKASGIATNHAGFCGQVEMEGWAADTINWSQDSLIKSALPLAQFTRWLRLYHNSLWQPLPYDPLGQEALTAGTKGVARMTKGEWQTGNKDEGGKWNVATHQNVPGNKHWDCGRLQLGAICAHAKLIADAYYNTDTKTPRPTDPKATTTYNFQIPKEATPTPPIPTDIKIDPTKRKVVDGYVEVDGNTYRLDLRTER